MAGADPEAVAEALADAHPDAEPWETPWPVLAGWLTALGVDPEDDALVAAALTAWELLRA